VRGGRAPWRLHETVEALADRYREEKWLPSIRASVRPATFKNYCDLFLASVKATLGRTLLVNAR
jgi:hypothetical protein